MAQLEKTTNVPVDGVNYTIRRMAAATGSFIWQRIMGGVIKAQMSAGESAEARPEEEQKKDESTPEQKFKTTYAFASMYFDFKDHEFIQREALRVVSRVEERGGAQLPMPVYSDTIGIAIPEIACDPVLVSRLVIEALSFNLSCFLS